MARNQHLHPMTADQLIQAQIRDLTSRVKRLRQTTTTTVRQATTGQIDDPLEGELIIDYLDNKVKWYSNGAWRECICEVLGIFAGIVSFWAEDSTTYEAQIYTIDPDTPNTSTLIVPSADYTETIRAHLWNVSQNKLYYFRARPSLAYGYEFRSCDADGTNHVDIAYYTSFSSPSGTIARGSNGDMVGMYYENDPNPDIMHVVDLSTGLELGQFPASVVSGMNQFATMSINPALTKISTIVRESGVGTSYYIINIDGTNVVGPILTNTWDPNRAQILVWNPSGNGQLMYVKIGDTPYNSVWTINEDGSNNARVYNPPYNAFIEKAKYSPDGTMIAYTYGSEIFVVNSDGSGLVCLIEPGAIWWGGIEYEWSLDGQHFVVTTYDTYKIYIADLATQTVTEVLDVSADPDMNGYVYYPICGAREA